MPVTIKVAQHDARPVRSQLIKNSTSQDVLQSFANRGENANRPSPPILETVLGQQTSLPDSELERIKLSVQDHGLVRAAYYAYSEHYHLVLRPEDIWVAILTQFSFYVNANSEKLRSSFVSHKGKKGLILRDPEQADMGVMCRNMTKLIDQNIVDPKLREWILPSFTTTTIHDEVVAAVIMMGTLQKYFDYVFDCTCCGIPTVTLMGEVSDWEDIRRRIEKLKEYGKEPSQFCALLKPILDLMVASFTKGPSDSDVVQFWSSIIDRNTGSGMDTLSGWMVAFCFWDEQGTCTAQQPYSSHNPNPITGHGYSTLEFDSVPAGFVSVPVTYMSPGGNIVETKLLAGFVGFESTRAVNFAWECSGNHVPAEKAEEAGKDSNGLLPVAGRLWGKISRVAGQPKRFMGSALPGTERQSSQVLEHDSSSAESTGRKELTDKTKEKAPQLTWSNDDEINTLHPLTGWWMYEDPDKKTTETRNEFYRNKMENEWNGQASTGYVEQDGTVVVENGLPKY
ncbi:hypothetical protein B0I35DRAFT_446370 [Stachybotrys elegans]|uniref:DUF4419 domain-containing protein n=1 Tax=Stachybotrys elegans TaxID=80388 RepID=A0A8K0SDU7_9HYPO|nr:hypothetical protein B0I35DRAFT_446370 [Stachybotrys elegans]